MKNAIKVEEIGLITSRMNKFRGLHEDLEKVLDGRGDCTINGTYQRSHMTEDERQRLDDLLYDICVRRINEAAHELEGYGATLSRDVPPRHGKIAAEDEDDGE